ncbi:right-handed parallel beta-helix repeat-containing protein [Erythrobacter sp. sf7]|uniref:Right-handed parallel beta-helix repeat-containing protein n=1 Tax=Erythrobacter fulvus TaxID=2987523 RepID=A0ABT5JRH4_9SPHN|nr:parallel beta-helix domain-containing protein [Erythrobacter fulvus]MDC8755121.1 right-handed parallel beta-helix repeat-containing protein [Erythrobacter fulvus]
MNRIAFAAVLLASAAPLAAETHTIAPGEGAQERLQEALILAAPGDEIVLEAGRFVLTDGLSLDVDGVTLRGQSADTTILDFTSQQGAGEGLLVTSDNVTLRDFRMENPKGDGIKSKGADNIVYTRLIVTWTNGPDPSNGAYAIYPVESTGVLVDGVIVSGASDAGIYVGQSSRITVRNSIAKENVAGIEIENSRDALVENNIATKNTGGILVFDLPGLPVIGGGNVIVRNNIASDNNTPNFAPPGNIVAGVPSGTGIMVMANENVLIEDNIVSDNATAPFMIIAYTQTFDDARYNPFPRNVVIGRNIAEGGGKAPDLPGGEQLAAALGGAIPPVLWDGLSDPETAPLFVTGEFAGVSLNLKAQGQGMSDAQPSVLSAPADAPAWDMSAVGAPAELAARLK